ncbi:MAG: hypothetical protein GX282_02040 [Campylobacteraceae bacterium]|nr:hypothetical protein [Campylobacteraceae bacterium]
MYKRELDSLIGVRKVPNFILLRSSDEFLNRFYSRQILHLWGSDNIYNAFFDEYEFESLSAFLEPSLFGDKNIVYIKTNKFGSTKEIKELIAKCKRDKNNFLLYEFIEDGNAINQSFINAFEGNFARLFSPNTHTEALQLLNQICLMMGLRPNNLALLEIYKIHNSNLSLTVAELEKFKSLGYELNIDSVKKHVFGLSEVSFEEIFEKIINLQDFRDEFYTYIQSGSYNENELISYLYSAIFRIFSVHSYIKINGKFDLREILGYLPPKDVGEKLKTQALKFSTNQFKNMFICLNEIEYELKTKSGGDKTHFMLSGLLEFQRVISKR